MYEYDLTLTIQTAAHGSEKLQQALLKKLVPAEYQDKVSRKFRIEDYHVWCVGHRLEHIEVYFRIKSGDKFFRIAEQILAVMGDEEFRKSVGGLRRYVYIELELQGVKVLLSNRTKRDLVVWYTKEYFDRRDLRELRFTQLAVQFGAHEESFRRPYIPDEYELRKPRGSKEHADIVIRTFSK